MPIENWPDLQKKFLAWPEIGDAGKAALLKIVSSTHHRGWDWYQTEKRGEFARTGIRASGRVASQVFLILRYRQRELVAEWNCDSDDRPLHNIPNGRHRWSLTDLADELSNPQSPYLCFTPATRVPGRLPNDYR